MSTSMSGIRHITFFNCGGRMAAACFAFGLFFGARFACYAFETTCRPTVRPASVQDVFSDAEISAIRSSYDDPDGPPGRIIRGRHGWTHYILDLPTSSTESKGLVVLCHGVLVSSMHYDLAADILASNGYTVLRYDFFGHGYSKWEGRDEIVEYHPEVFVDQLEDVLEAAAVAGSDKCPEIVGFIGHSTGSLVGIYAEERWRTQGGGKQRHIPKLVLASPAIWAHKPPMAILADKVPALTTFVMKNIPVLQSLVHDAAFDLCDETFALDRQRGEYCHPEEKQKIEDLFNRLFGRVKGIPAHPFLTGSFIGVNQHMLRGDLLPGHVQTLENLLNDSAATKVLFVWGNLDLTVPFKENIGIAKQWEATYSSSFQIEMLDKLGHDLFLADTHAVMESILPFLDDRPVTCTKQWK